MKRLLTLSLISFCLSGLAQTEIGVFSATGRGAALPFVTDYHCVGINPANLNLTPEYEGKTITFGFLEGAGSMYSEYLTKSELKNIAFQKDFDMLSQSERSDYAARLADKETAISLNTIASGIAVNNEKLGGFAFVVRDRVNMSATLGPQLSELVFLGKTSSYFEELVLNNGDTIPNTGNLPADTLNMVESGVISPANALKLADLLANSRMGFSWIREYNLAYGKRLYRDETIEIHGGIGGKFITGNAWLEVDATSNNVQAFSALSPVFDINYGEIAQNNPSALDQNAGRFTPVGKGWGVDLGATVVVKQKLLLSASITDIGRIKWTGNLYELNNQLFTDFTDAGAETNNLVSELLNFASPTSVFEWTGTSERTTKLPTTARVGAGYVVSPKLRLAVDAVMPVNDVVVNYSDPIIAAGADLKIFSFMQLSAGAIGGGDRELKIPVGITFIAGKGAYEAGFASRDMITWFAETNPTASLSWGFLRFRI
ncbi:MAG: hypothetical protein GC193_07660 [Cryomorphaceae bacterium]|nr:hypothetical protein [Cryomorphaceae bacterium]